MTALLWDQSGERIYEAGLDRGVLYLPEGNAVVWNGLISVAEKPTNTSPVEIFFDGVKYAETFTAGNFSATLRAYTYPDEFLQFEGIQSAGNGLYVANQSPGRFGLSYRTKIGDDINGDSLGYKIHVIYNLTAYPSQKSYQSNTNADATAFEWTVNAIPEQVSGYRPTAHLIFDSRDMGDLLLEDIERRLYGDDFVDASLPPLSTLVSFISDWVIIRITDNLDGTWTATGPDNLITMLGATEFQIIQANAIYSDADTYAISDLTY